MPWFRYYLNTQKVFLHLKKKNCDCMQSLGNKSHTTGSWSKAVLSYFEGQRRWPCILAYNTPHRPVSYFADFSRLTSLLHMNKTLIFGAFFFFFQPASGTIGGSPRYEIAFPPNRAAGRPGLRAAHRSGGGRPARNKRRGCDGGGHQSAGRDWHVAVWLLRPTRSSGTRISLMYRSRYISISFLYWFLLGVKTTYPCFSHIVFIFHCIYTWYGRNPIPE